MPTRDIHMKQISFEEGWLHFLAVYVQPLQQRVYEGYFDDVRIHFPMWYWWWWRFALIY